MLDEAIRQAASRRPDGFALEIVVNVSATNLLARGFTESVRATLPRHGLPAGSLILETTEDVLMSDPSGRSQPSTRSPTRAYVSVDDFGTGYSSIEYLKRLPLAEFKLVRAFIGNLANDHAVSAIVQAIIQLGQHLGIAVVAEGIRTPTRSPGSPRSAPTGASERRRRARLGSDRGCAAR